VEASIEQAVERLAREGAQVSEVRTEPLQRYAAVNRVILTSEAWSVHARWLRERPQDYGALTRERLMPGAFFSAGEYIDALRLRTRLAAAFNALFADVDVVITASAHDPACRIDDPAEVERTYGRQARAPFNLTGNPALAMPTGFSKQGLPLGLQIVGRAFDEATVCRAGDALEAALGLPRRLAEPAGA
jgi:aspartyl-tRNA(Asn)/glutamyl-tRNA(Gln) amidotransferase subunit A